MGLSPNVFSVKPWVDTPSTLEKSLRCNKPIWPDSFEPLVFHRHTKAGNFGPFKKNQPHD